MSFAYMNTGHSPLEFRLKDLPVFFSDTQCLEVIEAVLDESGNIKSFPGIVEDEIWTEKRRVGTVPDVRYEAQFYALNNNEYLMLWMIQPNGWYWVDDDGFGFTGDSSIMLYSLLDEKGAFTKEFNLFSIDNIRYCQEFDKYLSK